MKTRLASSAALALALIATVATSATAERGVEPKCPKGALCVWADANYSGQRVVVKSNKSRGKILQQMNDQTSSAFMNKGKSRVGVLYRDFQNEVPIVCLAQNNDFRIPEFDPSIDDQVSSSIVRKKTPKFCSQ